MGILLVDGKVSCWHYIFQLISSFWHPSPFAATMWMRRLVHVDGIWWQTQFLENDRWCLPCYAGTAELLTCQLPSYPAIFEYRLFWWRTCCVTCITWWAMGPWSSLKGMVVVQTSMADVYSRLWCLGCLKQLLNHSEKMCLKQGFFNKCFKQCPRILKRWQFKSFKVWKTLPIKSSSDGMLYPLVK